MTKVNEALLSFNRGIISKLAQGRVDIKRTALAAEIQTNWMPRVLGSMMLRPGTKYIGTTKDNAAALHVPFVFSANDTAIVEITPGVIRVRVNEEIITRPSTTASVANGSFTSDIYGWTDNDEGGATSSWVSGAMSLQGNGTNAAIRDQQIISPASKCAIRFVVSKGKVTVRIGTAIGLDDVFSESVLGVGTHSLSFTPSGNFWIRLMSREGYSSLIDSVSVESAGDLELPVSYAESDLQNIRFDQSGDIIYLACNGFNQKKIERRSAESWSVVDFCAEDGPFMPINISPTTITPSAISGDVTLSASSSLFNANHVGALFRLSSSGQVVQDSFSSDDDFSDYIRVFGVDNGRVFAITLSGTWTATVTLQRSIESPGVWSDVFTYSSNVSVAIDDALDNQIIYYRIGIKAGDYTSGDVDVSIVYSAGSISGIAKITSVASDVSASAYALKDFGGTDATSDWEEGYWSPYRGFPSCLSLHEGRLWFAGKDKLWGSISDSYESFDDQFIGDAGTISRSIGSGPVDTINWLTSVSRLIVGGQGSEFSAQSSSLDEPLTPTNFNLKETSNLGSYTVAAVKIDGDVVFVQKSGRRLYGLSFDGAAYRYTPTDFMPLCPEIGTPSIVSVAVQRQPDTRIHCVRSDGKVAILIASPAEEVSCWMLYETNGLVKRAFVMPGMEEDSVYYQISRTINGTSCTMLEKWALESECVGGAVTKLADCHVLHEGIYSDVISASHLEGESVVVWANGKDYGEFIVSGGSITLPERVISACVGLGYSAQFKSMKLAFGAQLGTALFQRKRISQIGLLLADCHANGVKYGSDFDSMDDLPLVEDGVEVAPGYIWEAYDKDMVEFNGSWGTDSRLCLQADAPRPCTVLAVAIGMATHDKG